MNVYKHIIWYHKEIFGKEKIKNDTCYIRDKLKIMLNLKKTITKDTTPILATQALRLGIYTEVE